MTITEAMEMGVKEVRKPYWNPTAKIILPETRNGLSLPWCLLVDSGQEIQMLLSKADDGDNDWLPAGNRLDEYAIQEIHKLMRKNGLGSKKNMENPS
jgi:hypothetical protein